MKLNEWAGIWPFNCQIHLFMEILFPIQLQPIDILWKPIIFGHFVSNSTEITILASN